MPTSTGNGKDIGVRANIAKDLERGVMLEQEVHFNTHSADVFEHVGELHVLRVRPKAIKTARL